jgi:hypothetical protein
LGTVSDFISTSLHLIARVEVWGRGRMSVRDQLGRVDASAQFEVNDPIANFDFVFAFDRKMFPNEREGPGRLCLRDKY